MLDPDVVGMSVMPLGLLKYHRRWTYPTFYIATPDYTYMHSGVRCLHLLCHHLNRLGYRAFVTTVHTNRELRTPYAEPPSPDRRSNHIVVYPEVFEGNRYNSRRVVRYLLNKPGVLTDFGLEAYGDNDYFIHFLDAFRPDGLTSRQLRIPLVDKVVFHLPKVRQKRKGFIVYSVRNRLDPSSLPLWARNCVTVTRANPRSPAKLAELYRGRRAFITGERTAAAIEAMHCGCPILLIPNPSFDYRPTVDFFDGNGIGIGVDRMQLLKARRTLHRALDRYSEIYRQLDESIHSFVEDACRHFHQNGL